MRQYRWLCMSVEGWIWYMFQDSWDFSIEEKEFPVTVFRRKISSIWEFVETPGHVAVITRRGQARVRAGIHRNLRLHVG